MTIQKWTFTTQIQTVIPTNIPRNKKKKKTQTIELQHRD